MCSYLYIKTHLAWYILESPAEVYRPFFLPFWTQCRLFHLIASACLVDPCVTLHDFLSSLQVTPSSTELIISTVSMLGRPLVEDDFMETTVVSLYLSTSSVDF